MQNLLIRAHQCHQVAYSMSHLAPTNLLSPSSYKKTKKQGQYKIVYLSKKKSLKTFLESMQETTPKAENGEGRRSNRTRQNNKRTDRKTTLRFQTGGRRLWQSSTSEESGLPSDQQNGGV